MPERRGMLTKIIATVGKPDTRNSSREILTRLVEEGVSVFRLNFSHGDLDAHRRNLELIRDIERELDRPIGVLGDLAGPKIRIGMVQDGGVMLEAGDDVVLQREPIVATGKRFSLTHPEIIDDLSPGQKVLINDGAIRMLVVEGGDDEVLCRVTTGGLVTSRKGLNVPNSPLRVETITDWDWTCLEWAVEHQLDFIALSFVRQGDDLRRLRERMVELTESKPCRPLPIVAKIEKPQALENIDDILDAADAIMVARGDLGVEMDLAEVPVIQKRLVDKANERGRPCIVATQMLETMMTNPSPTRAEASDVANAILDGADAIMLSGETAVGNYPVLAVETMARIAASTEAYLKDLPEGQSRHPAYRGSGEWIVALSHGAWSMAREVNARYIVAWSKSGLTALYLSRSRFPVPTIVCSDDDCTTRRLTLLYGVRPVRLPLPEDADAFTQLVDQLLVERQLVRKGEAIVMVAGHPLGLAGTTNSIALHAVGNPNTGYRRRSNRDGAAAGAPA